MFFLLLVALASAADYIVNKTPYYGEVTPLDVCASTGASTSEKYKKATDAKKVKKCTYPSNDCSGKETCVDEDLGTKTIVNKIPENLGYVMSGSKSDCSETVVNPDVYFKDCAVAETNKTWIQFVVENKKLIAKYYTDKDCKAAFNGTATDYTPKIEMECDKCQSGSANPKRQYAAGVHTKLFCSQYNGSAFTAILMVVFALFFLF